MGVSIHKVVEEKLHKQNKQECELATVTMEAFFISSSSSNNKQSNTSFSSIVVALLLLLPCPSSHCYFHNCSLRAPLGQERYCNLEQSACVERLCTRTSQMKYTLQGCAYDCAHTLAYA